ncbi:hypothetical protein MTR67_035175 [Solanum verrucosum]|uniref:Uncharacterized protein n=1 Tax=Solanum verrucosum TaxID=315347 RepID=A0AAF0U9T6_SOLVR|nr:hypothetical protein MTR67_035175 [Solanum verrucosum]
MNSDAVPPVTYLVEHSYAAQPIVDPIWRGCYTIWNNKYTLDGVVAHLSYKASQKATIDDIELIFFPSEARHQDKFYSMVEDMIGGENALRWGATVFHIHRTAPASLDDCHDNKFPIMNSDPILPGTDLVEHSHVVQLVDDPILR